MSYFQDIQDGIRTTLKGLSITMRHLRQATESRKPLSVASDNYFEQQTGLVTVQYPHEQLPIPDNGRYRLHNEIDDCIVCDKCAKVCPVDCIIIDAIKATEEVGRASDGSPIRLYAATFDIDMAKCCYCGLCTVVCPTECLTMEKKFDYSEFDLGKLTYGFANLTADQAEEKRQLYEQFVAEKAAQKNQTAPKPTAPVSDAEVPTIPAAPKVERKPSPVFRPTIKAKTDTTQVNEVPHQQEEHTVQPTNTEEATPKPMPAKPAFRPTMKPPAAKIPTASMAEKPEPTAEIKSEAAPELLAEETPKPKPAGFRPTMKPKATLAEPNTEVPMPPAESTPEEPKAEAPEEAKPKPKVPFRPTMKPKNP